MVGPKGWDEGSRGGRKERGFTWRHGMRGISDQRHPAFVVLPWLRDPVADISFVDKCVLWNPGECRTDRFAHLLGPRLDQFEAFFIAERVIRIAQPCHSKMENPCLWVIRAVGHARNYQEIRLEPYRISQLQVPGSKRLGVGMEDLVMAHWIGKHGKNVGSKPGNWLGNVVSDIAPCQHLCSRLSYCGARSGTC